MSIAKPLLILAVISLSACATTSPEKIAAKSKHYAAKADQTTAFDVGQSAGSLAQGSVATDIAGESCETRTDIKDAAEVAFDASIRASGLRVSSLTAAQVAEGESKAARRLCNQEQSALRDALNKAAVLLNRSVAGVSVSTPGPKQ